MKLSNGKAVLLGEEVREALDAGRPVVALESSVIAQGLAPPHNLEVARACEQAIRAAGAVPATTALIEGTLRAGLTDAELQRLADPSRERLKAAARDLPFAAAGRKDAGTTVSATCVLADAAGIRFFATGGIGGVHREAEKTFDVSQDLGAIAACNVAVVTAGAKSILDLPRTLEVLETLGVPVVGFGVREFPAFYSSRSGLPLEQSVSSAQEAAALLRARWELLGQQGGVVLANPVPAEAELPAEQIEQIIESALERARSEGIRGKAVTPYLLAEIGRQSSGESVKANLALLVDNARVAAEIAVAYHAAQ